MPSRPKTLRLHGRVVNPNRAAAGLGAVDHQVVGLGPAFARIGRQQFEILLPRCGERMVHGGPGVCLLHPRRTSETRRPTRNAWSAGSYSFSSSPNRLRRAYSALQRDLERIGHEQQQVARRGLHPLGNLGQACRELKFLAIGEASVPPSSTLNQAKPLAPKSWMTNVGQLVDAFARIVGRRPLGVDAAHAAARLDRRAKDAKLALGRPGR